MEVPTFTDFLVTSHSQDGELDPQVLDRVLNQMGAVLIQNMTPGGHGRNRFGPCGSAIPGVGNGRVFEIVVRIKSPLNKGD